MKTKRALRFLSVLSIVLLPFIFFHKSANPAFWIWSAHYLFFIILYAGFLALSLFCYLRLSVLGKRFCVYILCVYIAGFFLADFIVGSVNYYANVPILLHPVYHHITSPGKYKVSWPEGVSLIKKLDFSVSSAGLRSRGEIPMVKEENTFRILVLGDSFVLGVGVSDDETLCYLLERDLNDSLKKGKRYEVINAGVGSYVPLLEYLYFKTDGIKFDPDMVILFFDMGDLWQTQEYLRKAIMDKDGNVVRVVHKISVWNDIYAFIRARFYFLSHFIGKAEGVIKRELNKGGPGLWGVNTSLLEFTLNTDQSRWDKEWQRIYADIGLVKDFCEERGIEFAAVIYPWGHQVNGREWADGRQACGIPLGYTAPPDLSYMLEEKLQNMDISVLNLFPAFRNYKGEDMLYYRKDLHWTRCGHRFAAEQLFNFIKDSRINKE
ncbi:MAG: SGNH/GDSL hydrolase family protein [Candidatus Omnitrophota bacterium]